MREKIVIASGNAGKVREIRAALAPLGAELPSLADLGAAQTAEPHPTFFENALAKARAASFAAKSAAVADDSGLVVPALDGAPGVHSARFSGENADDSANNEKLLALLAESSARGAFYYAAIVFVAAPEDPAPVFAEGFWRGEILRAPRGAGGFGYDPLFFDPAAGKTGAQMSVAEKNEVSHRGQSLRELTRLLALRDIAPRP
ncbi:MAG: RdgB/HAM1 family non-canonical purine NTP pyrophosphatase [Gammaproteobacteria bacterium]